MLNMTDNSLNLQARKGTADSFCKLLKAYGHDRWAMHVLQLGIDGYTYQNGAVFYSGFIKDKNTKQGLMSGFRVGESMCTPQPPGELNEIRAKLNELTGSFNAIQEKLGFIAPVSTISTSGVSCSSTVPSAPKCQ